MTNTAASDALVADYLDDLERALDGAPGSRRRELVGEIAAHIEQARGELADGGSEAEIRTLLERLGDPAEIAAGERDEEPPDAPAPARPVRNWTDGLALVLLPIGGVLIPVLGWFVGVALLWGSERWTTREKLVGTFVLPGGYVPLFWLLFLGSGTESGSCTQEVDFETGAPIGPEVCTNTSDGTTLPDALMIAIVVVLAVAPLFTVLFLRRRLRQRTT